MAIDPMEALDNRDGELSARLRRLEAVANDPRPGFDYAGLIERQEAKKSRARRRAAVARGGASALVLAMVAVSVWRLNPPHEVQTAVVKPVEIEAPQQRLVRADTYLALAAIEDHIATIDDALSDARLIAPRGVEVARLERTRAELLDSYAHVRYAEMVSTSF